MQDDKAVEDLEDHGQSDSTHEDEEPEEKGISDSSDEGDPSAVTSVPPKKTKPSFIGVKRMYGTVTLDKALGSGAFGTVYKGTWNGRTVAFKEIDIKTAHANQLYGELGTVGLVESLEWEVSRLSTISHPHCVSFYGVYEKEDKYYIGMEFCRGGTLDKALQKGVSWETRYRWAWEMAQGLAYLHDSGVLHRDLKAENILLDAGRAKLGDLGAAEADVLLSDTQAQVVSKGLQDKTFISPERGLSDYNGSMGYEDLSDSPHQKIVWVAAKDVPKDDALDPQVVYVTLNKGKVWSTFLKKDPEKEGLKVSRVIITDPKTIAQVQAGFAGQTEISRADSEEKFETLSLLCGHVKCRLADTPAMDMYALGLVFWQMASGGSKPGRPDELDPQRYQNFLLNEAYLREPFPADCPEAFRELILRCWSYDPAQRPSAAQLATQLQGLLQEKAALMSEASATHPDIVEVSPEDEALDEPEGIPDSDAEDTAAIEDSTITPSSGYVAAPAPLTESLLSPEEDQGVPDSESEEEKITSPTQTSLTSQTALHNASVDSLSMPGFQAVDRLEHDVHDKRSSLLAYLPPYLTASKVNEPIDDYWRRIENAKEGEAQNKNAPLVLKQLLDDFLSDTQSGVLLLLGEAGLGKTLTTYQRANQLLEAWRDYLSEEGRAKNTPRPAYFPILLRPALSQWTHGHLQNEGLDKALEAYGLTGRHIPLLVIVDGYDECQKDPDAEPQNLVEELGLQAYAKTAPVKVLVTCRPDTVAQRELQSRFGWEGTLSVKYFLPFKLEQMLEYMKAQSGWDDKTYQENRERLSKAKDLRTVLRNPFVLQLFTQSWETVSRQKADLNQLKRWDVYAGFVAHWLKTQESLLQERVKAGLVAETPDLVKSFEIFAAQVAFTAFTQGQIALSGDIPQKNSLAANPWLLLPEQVKQEAKRAFSENRASLTKAQKSRALLQEGEYVRIMENRLGQFESGSPLKRRAGGHEFTHKSFFEYFCAVRLLQLSTEKTPVRIMHEGQALLNHRNVQEEPEILTFWQEGWQEKHRVLIEPFFEVIQVSRVDKNMSQASSNAATLLNTVKVDFSGRDLRKVILKGADLSGAILDHTNLSEANLERAKLSNAFLRETDLRNANLDEVNFGQFPMLSFEDRPICLSYSPDGHILAIGFSKGVIALWQSNYSNKISEWRGHTDWVSSIAFSPDGKTLISGSWDSTIRLWDVASGQAIAELKGHTAIVTSVAFSSDGKMIVSGSLDTTIRLWDVASGQAIAELKGHISNVNSVAFSLDNKIIASGSSDETIKLWSVSQKQEVNTFKKHTESVETIVFSYDSTLLASGSSDRTIILWDISKGQEIKTFTGHTNKVVSIAFSPDSKILASGSEDKRIFLWEISSGQLIDELKGHTNYISGIVFHPDGKSILSGSWDNTVRIWDIMLKKSFEKLKGHESKVKIAMFSKDNRFLASGSEDNKIYLWDIENKICVKEFHIHQNSKVSFSSKGKTMVYLDWDENFIIKDLITDKLILKLKENNKNEVSTIIYSQNGEILCSTAVNRLVCLWNTENGELIKELNGHAGFVLSAEFSPDSKMLASGGADKTVRLWDPVSGVSFPKFDTNHSSWVSSVTFSPDGKVLASGSADKKVYLWDVIKGNLIKKLTGHKDWVLSISFNPNGDILASGGADKIICLWDTSKGKLVKKLTGHNEKINSVTFSLDGEMLVSGSDDTGVFLWKFIQKDWLLVYRFMTSFILHAFNAHLSGATLSQKNLALLKQQGAEDSENILHSAIQTTLTEDHKTTENSQEVLSIQAVTASVSKNVLETNDAFLFRSFFRIPIYKAHGERIASYLSYRDKQAMACVSLSCHGFFNQLQPEEDTNSQIEIEHKTKSKKKFKFKLKEKNSKTLEKTNNHRKDGQREDKEKCLMM